MSSRAQPRLANLTGVRRPRSTRPYLTARVTSGPQSELGRNIHLPLDARDIYTLRDAVKRLEQLHTCPACGQFIIDGDDHDRGCTRRGDIDFYDG